MALLMLLSSVALNAASEGGSVEGKLVIVGSDTLGALTSTWSEMLSRQQPRLLVQVRAIGSSAAPTALIQGTADIGPMSRSMSADEEAKFIRRYGYAPTAVSVAEDAVAVFVHRDNPLEALTVSELDAIFSSTRRCGHAEAIRSWALLGLAAPWGERNITAYGRSSASGTYSFFRQNVLCAGDFAPHMNRLVGSSAVVRAVATDRGGVGFASSGYLNANVKEVRVVADADGRAVNLSRQLLVYINLPPGAAPEPEQAAFLRVALGSGGQREVVRAGYLPLAEEQRVRQLRRLGVGDD